MRQFSSEGRAYIPLALAVAAMLVIASAYTHLIRGPLIEGVGSVDGPVRAGEVALVHWVITKRTDCPGESSRVWSGADGFYLADPMRATGLPMGDLQRSIQTTIPSAAPSGPLTLTIRGRFDCLFGAVPFRLAPVQMDVVD